MGSFFRFTIYGLRFAVIRKSYIANRKSQLSNGKITKHTHARARL